MKGRKILAITLVGLLLTSGLLFLAPSNGPDTVKAHVQSPTYPNSYDSTVWVRKNGSDPGFAYGGAGQPASVGMDYFGTNVIQVTWGYNWTEIADTSIFPSTAVLYIQTSYDAGFATVVADVALTDSRIRGVFIDDFVVGRHSPANMSAIYTAIHHEDATLGYNLTLGLVVYQYNYYVQSPNTWASIGSYFDIIHFWFYPRTYPLLYSQFVGYEDAFMELHSWLPDKEYWMGIYLHYYNAGSYPADFTYQQVSIASRLIKEGYATRLSILETFWIQHNVATSLMVHDFLFDELSANHTNALDLTTGNTTTPGLITGFQITSPRNYTFTSAHLQNLTLLNDSGAGYVLQDIRTGHHVNASVNGSDIYFILEPGVSYKLSSMPLTMLNINTKTYLTTKTSWNNRLVIVKDLLYVNTTLWVNNSIIRVSDYKHQDSMYNGTIPQLGIIFNGSSVCNIYMKNSTIEPVNRLFPYYLNTSIPNGTTRVFSFKNTTLACYASYFRPIGYITFEDCHFFQTQPWGGTYFWSLFLLAPAQINSLSIIRTTIWNYPLSGSVGLFIMPENLWTHGDMVLDDITIVGAAIGLWLDMTWTSPVHGVGITNLINYGSMTNYEVQGASFTSVSISSNSTSWSMDESLSGPNVTFTVTGLQGGYTYDATMNGTRIARGNGPTLIFQGTGGGAYQVTSAFTVQIFNLLILIPFFLTLGVIMIPVNYIVKQTKTKKPIQVREVVRMFIMIVVGLALVGITYTMV